LEALLTLLLASALSFHHPTGSRGLPGYAEAESKISPERIEALRQQFGLDRSWRAIRWLWRIFTQGDFGTSFVYQRSVASLLWERQQHYCRIFNCYLGVLGYHRRRQTKSLVDRRVTLLDKDFQLHHRPLLLIFAQYTSPLFPVGSINHADLSPLGKF